MKDKRMSKGILGAFIILMALSLVTHSYGASADEKQVAGKPETVLPKDRKTDSEKHAQPNLDIIFVLDNSGSMMKNDPMFITRKVVTNFLTGLKEGFRLGMVIFDQDARLVEPLTDITIPENSTRFLKSLDHINYKGQFTNSPAGVERAIYELKKRGRNEAGKVLVLLTDGIIDTGDKRQDLEGENWLKENLAQECQQAQIRIFGIAFTDKADFRLIQILASKTNGEYFRAYSAEDIPVVFSKIIEIITKPLEKHKPLAIPPSAPVIVIPQKETPAPALPDQRQAVKKEIALLPLILSALAVLMAVIMLALIFKRKTENRIASEGYKERPPKPLPPNHPVFQAELIDADNIVSKDSLSLTLNKESVSIGRDSSNDIVIPKESVSSLHATIEYKNGHFYLEDHRSTNGTRLNGKEVRENEPVRLKSGDKIHFAVYEFRFLLHDQAPFGETVMLHKDKI